MVLCGDDPPSPPQESTGQALAKSVLDATAAAGTYALTNYFDLGTSVLLLWYGGQLVLDNQDLSPGQLIKFQVRVMILF